MINFIKNFSKSKMNVKNWKELFLGDLILSKKIKSCVNNDMTKGCMHYNGKEYFIKTIDSTYYGYINTQKEQYSLYDEPIILIFSSKYTKDVSFALEFILHRDGDDPAVEFSTGDKQYYKNGELYRENGLPDMTPPFITKTVYSLWRLLLCIDIV